MHPNYWKIPKSECPDIWIRLPRHKWPKSWSSMEDPVVPLDRNLYGHPLAGLLWEKQFEKILLQHGWEKVSKLGMSLRAPPEKTILICVCGRHQIGWKEAKHWSDVETTQQRSRFGRTNIFPWSWKLGLHSMTMWNKRRYCGQVQSHVRIANFSGENRKASSFWESSYFFMVVWHGGSCKEVCGTILWVGKQDDSTNSTKYLLHASMTATSKRKKQNLLEKCQTHALKLFWNAYTWQELEDLIFYGQWKNLHDRLQNGPKLVTNAWVDWYFTFTHMWIQTVLLCGKHCTTIQTGTVSRLRFSRRSWGLKIHFWRNIMRFGKSTFVSRSWMCKKQTSVSHSSTESEIISLDAGLRLDDIPALDLWDLIVLVLGNTIQTHDRTGQPVVNCDKSHGPNKRSQGVFNVLKNIDCVPSNVQFSHQEALLFVLEDNEAVIKMIIEGRSPTMRLVSRTHKVTCTQHATQSGMMTKLGLLKSGNLINRWMKERGNPL